MMKQGSSKLNLTLLCLCLTATKTFGLSPLRDNLKFQQTEINKSSSLENKMTVQEKNNIFELGQSDPVFKDYKTPFTASPEYDYLDNFVLGLKLETNIQYSADCLDSLVYAIDDYAYFQNNLTDFNPYAWEAPALNLSKAIGGNFSYVPYNCYRAGYQLYDATKTKLDSFNYNVGDFFLAFLFNLMGNSLALKKAFDDIANNQENQYYVDIALQYGKIIYLLVSFDASDLVASPNPMAKESPLLQQARQLSAQYNVSERINENLRSVKRSVSKLQTMNQKLKTYVSNPQVRATWSANANSLLTGAIGVLPSGSFLKLCESNITATQEAFTDMIDAYIVDPAAVPTDTRDIDEVLNQFQKLLSGQAGITFSCFYSIRDPAGIGANEDLIFGPKLIAWNVLYNLGYMYTDVTTIQAQYATGSPVMTTVYQRIGDFIMRFFYSRYLER